MQVSVGCGTELTRFLPRLKPMGFRAVFAVTVPRADAVDAETDVPVAIADEKSDSDESEATERPVSESVTNEYAYEFQDIRQAIHNGFEIRDWLTDTVGFDSADVFYSGQGVHIYAKSDDPYLKLTHQSRKYIGRYINERLC